MTTETKDIPSIFVPEKKTVPFGPMDTSNEDFVLQALQRLHNMDPSDRTVVRCDICNINAFLDKGMGGVILKEPTAKFGWYTFVCQHCFDNFISLDKNEQKKLKNDSRYAPALKNRIGVDSRKHIQMDMKKSFYANVLLWRKQNPLESQFKAIISSKPKKDAPFSVGPSTSQSEITGEFKMSCNYCKLFRREHELKKCMNCLLARYCNKDCQTRDWSNHKQMCTLLETEERHQAFAEFLKNEQETK